MFMVVTPENLHNRPYGRSPAIKVLGRKAAIITAPEGRHHNPLNLLNPLNLGRKAAPLGVTTTLGPKGRQT